MQACVFTILPFYCFTFLFELLCERLHVESELGEARACGAFHGDNLVHVIVERLDEYTPSECFEPVGTVFADGIEFFGDDVLCKEGIDDVVYPYAVHLDDIVDEYRAVVVVPVQHPDIGVDARLDERSLNPAVEDSIAIVEKGVRHVERRMLRPDVETELLREEGIDGAEVDARSLPLPSAEHGSDVVDDVAVEDTDLVAVVLQPGDVLLRGFVRVVARVEEQHQCLLVFNLPEQDLLDPVYGAVGIDEVQLPFPDGGDAAVLRTPYPSDRFPCPVHEHDFYLVFHGQHHGITRDLCAAADLYAVYADGRYALFSVGRADDESLVVAVEGDTVSVEYQFHKVLFLIFYFFHTALPGFDACTFRRLVSRQTGGFRILIFSEPDEGELSQFPVAVQFFHDSF